MQEFRTRNNNGFSLIEMTIALLVIMIMAVPAIQAYKQWNRDQQLLKTDTNSEKIYDAIEDFYFANSRYPCPADPTLTQDDPGYGEEMAGCPDPGFTMDDPPDVIEGSVPFKTLGLLEENIVDAWDRKFTYLVTNRLAHLDNRTLSKVEDETTTPPTEITFLGAINKAYQDLADADENGIADTPPVQITRTVPAGVNSGHAALISHGDRGTGARMLNGQLYASCPSVTAAREGENCDGDSDIIADEGQFTKTRSLANNSNYYDDYVRSISIQSSKIWVPDSDHPEDINTSLQYLGINTENPMGALSNEGDPLYLGYTAPEEPVRDEEGNILYQSGIDVNGNVKIEGAAASAEVCDERGNLEGLCFYPELIAGSGDTGGLKCNGAKQWITSIYDNTSVCFEKTKLTESSCDDMARGIKSSGEVRCKGE